MKPGDLKDFILTVIVIVSGFAVIVGSTGRIESVRPPLPVGYDDADLTVEGGRLRGYSFGAEGLVADWYWTRSLQYLGDKIAKAGGFAAVHDLKSLNPRLLYPLLDNASTLDPRFMTVYTYGATVLPDINPQQAIALTEKGIANNPDQWRLYHFLGYIYWELKDYPKAAEIYERGSQLAGAPNWMHMMAVNMQSEGGSRETAREIYAQVYNEAQDEETRLFAESRLLGLDSMDEREAVNAALASFMKANGRCPEYPREVIPMIRKINLPHGRQFRVDKNNNLVDPSDTPYIFDAEKCDLNLDRVNTKVASN